MGVARNEFQMVVLEIVVRDTLFLVQTNWAHRVRVQTDGRKKMKNRSKKKEVGPDWPNELVVGPDRPKEVVVGPDWPKEQLVGSDCPERQIVFFWTY